MRQESSVEIGLLPRETIHPRAQTGCGCSRLFVNDKGEEISQYYLSPVVYVSKTKLTNRGLFMLASDGTICRLSTPDIQLIPLIGLASELNPITASNEGRFCLSELQKSYSPNCKLSQTIKAVFRLTAVSCQFNAKI
jgi:hypothetical protein